MEEVKCITCRAGLLEGNVGSMWLYACGHVACACCATSCCCGDKCCLMDLLQDQMVASTRWYAQVLIPSVNTYQPIAQVLQSLQVLLTCLVGTYIRFHNESLPVQLPQEEDVFLSLETMRSFNNKPWQCPRDGRTVRAGQSRCECGYVNLKAVMMDPLLPTITEPPVAKVQKTKEVGNPNLWACTQCGYEYNLLSSATCKCKAQRMLRNACQQCGRECEAPGLCEGCRQTQSWVCEKCNRTNPLSMGLCPCTCWACAICHYTSNDVTQYTCTSCQGWKCKSCTVMNYPRSSACQTCGQLNR